MCMLVTDHYVARYVADEFGSNLCMWNTQRNCIVISYLFVVAVWYAAELCNVQF